MTDIVEEVARVLDPSAFASMSQHLSTQKREARVFEAKYLAKAVISKLEEMGWQPPGCAVSSAPAEPASRELVEDRIRLLNARLSGELRDLRSLKHASVALFRDMLTRAQMNAPMNDGEVIVEAGRGVWEDFCAALGEEVTTTALANTPEEPEDDLTVAYMMGRQDGKRDNTPDGWRFQDRVRPWLVSCFGEDIAADRLERCDRFTEEAMELVQAVGYDRTRAHALVDYVFDRDAGEPRQEVGGVMVTLAAFCIAHGLDIHEDGEHELTRISTPEVQAKIRAKQQAKPTGSALPVALPQPPEMKE